MCVCVCGKSGGGNGRVELGERSKVGVRAGEKGEMKGEGTIEVRVIHYHSVVQRIVLLNRGPVEYDRRRPDPDGVQESWRRDGGEKVRPDDYDGRVRYPNIL